MNRKRPSRIFRIAAFATSSLATSFMATSVAVAQCALCKSAITGSPNAAKLAQNFNFAILVLLIPPVLIFCGIFFAATRFRKAHGETVPDDAKPTRLEPGPMTDLR